MTDWLTRFQNAQEQIEKTGKDYAHKKALSWQMQELTSSIKSTLILEALSENPKTSQVKAEAIAKNSDRYVTHIKGTAVAIEEELTAKARYEKAIAHHESLRSLISLDKKLDGQTG